MPLKKKMRTLIFFSGPDVVFFYIFYTSALDMSKHFQVPFGPFLWISVFCGPSPNFEAIGLKARLIWPLASYQQVWATCSNIDWLGNILLAWAIWILGIKFFQRRLWIWNNVKHIIIAPVIYIPKFLLLIRHGSQIRPQLLRPAPQKYLSTKS